MPKINLQKWFVYILRCSDGSLYTGVATNLEKRLAAHKSGKGAKYTRGRVVEGFVYHSEHRDRGEAQRLEYQIKKLTKQEKLKLISEWKEKTH